MAEQLPQPETKHEGLEWIFKTDNIGTIELQLGGRTVAHVVPTSVYDNGALRSGVYRSGLAVAIYDPKTGAHIKGELVKTPRPGGFEVDSVHEEQGIEWVEREIQALLPDVPLPKRPPNLYARAKIRDEQEQLSWKLKQASGQK